MMALQPPITALQVVADAFRTLGVEFYIGGSIASAYHGEPRSTIDVDLIADLPASAASRLVHLLGEEFYADASMMIEAITSRTSFNLIHLPTMYKIDVFIPKQRPFDKSVRQRVVQAAAFEGDDRTYQIASVEDTVLSKLEWYKAGGETSERQWRDVVGVMQVQLGQLDQAYLERWATELAVNDLLQRAWTEARTLMGESTEQAI